MFTPDPQPDEPGEPDPDDDEPQGDEPTEAAAMWVDGTR